MKVIHTIRDLQELLDIFRREHKTIGLVPTMGALHQGHISLVEHCVKEADICVASIFVNPTQFNDKNDLLKYPRTLDADVRLLEKANCDIVFAPSVEEMYPEPDTRVFNFGDLEQVMEGAHRPGHFNGVAQIVSKLFDAVQPDKACFGEKDFQQLAIICAMTRQLNLPVEIIACPIIREENGLAMSSRNTRLTKEEQEKATLISKTLFESKKLQDKLTVEDLNTWIQTQINSEPLLTVEYVDIVDGNTLQAISSWTETNYAVACVAVFCGDVRLIDNIVYFRHLT